MSLLAIIVLVYTKSNRICSEKMFLFNVPLFYRQIIVDSKRAMRRPATRTNICAHHCVNPTTVKVAAMNPEKEARRISSWRRLSRRINSVTWGSHSSQPMHLRRILKLSNIQGIRRGRRRRRWRGRRRGTRVLADPATELLAGRDQAPIKINAFTAFLVTAPSNDQVEATSSPDASPHQNGRRRSRA